MLLSALVFIPIQAAEVNPYAQVLQRTNDVYATDLKFDYVDENVVSVDEFQRFVESVAEYSASTGDSAEYRQSADLADVMTSSNTEIKSSTKDVWGGWSNAFSISAEYAVNGNRIAEFRSASVNNKQPLIYRYAPNSGTPVTTIVDSGRTLTVAFNGSVQNAEDTISVSNVKLYAEFSSTD